MFRKSVAFTLTILLAFAFELSATQPSEIWNRIFKKNKLEKVEKISPTISSEISPELPTSISTGLPENNMFVRNANKGVVVIIDKSLRKLYVYEIDGDSKKLLDSYDAIFGKNNGDKVAKGDKRTPEGVYYIKSYKSADDLKVQYGKDGEIYGTGAFPINYPNPIDKLNSKTGNGIWIHGIGEDNKTVTRGCVALENDNLDKLKAYVSINTPIIIVGKTIEELPVSKDTFISTVDKLKNDYLKDSKVSKVYSEDNNKIFIQNESNFVIDFNTLACKNNTLSNENTRLYIVADDNTQDSYKVGAYESKPFPVDNELITSSVKSFINDWVATWNKQDINKYKSFYSKEHSFYGLSYNDYMAKKSKLFGEHGKISVNMYDINIRINSNRIYIKGKQDYVSNKLKTKGLKSLTVVGCPNDYKIINESWSNR